MSLTTPSDDPTHAELDRFSADARHEESARLKEAVQDHPKVREVLQAAAPARAWLEAFLAEHGPTWRARRAKLLERELVRRLPASIAPVRQRVLDEITDIEGLCGNAQVMRMAEARLAQVTLDEAHPPGADAPFLPSIVATLLQRLRDGMEAPRALREQWAAHEETWADLGRRLAARGPDLPPGNSQRADEPEIETPPSRSKGRFARGRFRRGDAA